MIGVILWRDVADGKAVIWCEDQGDLAFFDRLEDVLDPDTLLDVGDLVRFDLKIVGNLRLAQNVTRLLDNWNGRLADTLRKIPPEPAPSEEGALAVRTGATIVPFPVWSTGNRTAQHHDTGRRSG